MDVEFFNTINFPPLLSGYILPLMGKKLQRSAVVYHNTLGEDDSDESKSAR